MATSLQEKHKYTQTAEQLFGIHSNSDLIVSRYTEIQARNAQVSKCEHIGDSFHLHCQREVKTTIPKALASFAGEWNTILQKEIWNKKTEGVYECEFTLDIEGLPGSANGSMLIQNTASGCTNDIELSVNCSIPFIDKQVEKFILNECMDSISAEHQWTKEFFK